MPNSPVILNEGIDDTLVNESCSDPLLLSKKLEKLVKRIKGANLIGEQSEIDYESLYESPMYKEYIQICHQLKKVELDKLLERDPDSEEDRTGQNILAFFINIYNSLTIHAIVFIGNNKSNEFKIDKICKNAEFFGRIAYLIGVKDEVFTMDAIEHGILRGNRPHPVSNKILFGSGDKRARLSLKTFDPRIHFAINCGSKSCPAISFYTHTVNFTNLESGLDDATRNFLTSETKVNLANKSVELSKLLLWYREDFISDFSSSRWRGFAKKACHYAIIERKLSLRLKKFTSIEKDDLYLLEWIWVYLKDESPKKEKLRTLLDRGEKINITYAHYNWDINIKQKDIKPQSENIQKTLLTGTFNNI